MSSFFIFALLIMGGASSVEAQTFPLVTDLVTELLTEILPCMGPCVMDNLDYIVMEANLGVNSTTFKCFESAANTFGMAFADMDAEGVINLLSNNAALCPLLRNFEDCIIDQVKSLCGSGVSDDVRAYIRKVIKFVDCGVPAAEELNAVSCISEPLVPTLNVEFANGIVDCANSTFQQLVQDLNLVNLMNTNPIMAWKSIYDSEAPNFPSICKFAEDIMFDCCIDKYADLWDDTGRTDCQNLEREIIRQSRNLLSHVNCDGSGTGILRCLGDPTLYVNQTLTGGAPSGHSNFIKCGEDFIEDIMALLGEMPNLNIVPISEIVKYLATRTCKDVNILIECGLGILNAADGCGDWVIPTIKALYEPSLYYFNSIGTGNDGSSSCPLNEDDITDCRCKANYRVDTEIIGTCRPTTTTTTTTTTTPSAPMRILTVNVPVDNLVYSDALSDVNSPEYMDRIRLMQPVIDAILAALGADLPDFCCIVNIRFVRGSVVMIFDVAFFSPSPQISPNAVNNVIMTVVSGIVRDADGNFLQIDPRNVRTTPIVRPDNGNNRRTVFIPVIIAISAFCVICITVMTILCIRVYCCRPRMEKPRYNPYKAPESMVYYPQFAPKVRPVMLSNVYGSPAAVQTVQTVQAPQTYFYNKPGPILQYRGAF